MHYYYTINKNKKRIIFTVSKCYGELENFETHMTGKSTDIHWTGNHRADQCAYHIPTSDAIVSVLKVYLETLCAYATTIGNYKKFSGVGGALLGLEHTIVNKSIPRTNEKLENNADLHIKV